MRFLLRLAFWLGVILVLLPSSGSQPTPKLDVSATDAMSAAKAAVTDVRSMCERQPDACVVGSQVVVALGHRAQAGAKMIYEFLNEQLGPNDTGSVPATGAARSVPVASSPAMQRSQNTLMPSDLMPTWRGPQPQRASRERPA